MQTTAALIKQELKKKVYVLAVDDQRSNLLCLEELLNSDSIELVTAESGKEALKIISQYEFACILLDIRMPIMNGYQVAAIIRSDPNFAQTPIIFVTAEAKDQEELFQGYSSGAVDFLIKPLSPKILIAKVQVFAELYRQKKALDKSALIEELYGRLKDSNDQLKQYTHIASHDMREPIRRIQCLLDLLRINRTEKLDADFVELYGDLTACSTELLTLVDNFREITDIVNAPRDQTEIEWKPLIEQVVGERKGEIEKRRIDIEIGEHPSLACNPPLIKNLFRYLLDNALMHSGAGPIAIRFFADRTEDGWIMNVFNSGPPIDVAKAESIFQPCTRLAATSKSQHVGMGLTKVKKIVEHHNGEVWVESRPDGVCFKFTMAAREHD